MPDERSRLWSRLARKRKVEFGSGQSIQYNSNSSNNYSAPMSRHSNSYNGDSISIGYIKTKDQTRNVRKLYAKTNISCHLFKYISGCKIAANIALLF